MQEQRASRKSKRSSGAIRLDDAIAAVKEIVVPVYGSERVSTADVRKRVLALDIIAPVDLPLRDSSAVDGYAVRHADIPHFPAILTVVGEAAAGHPYSGSLGPGAAVRIFTGGAVPSGADRVVMQEHCHSEGDRVIVSEAGKRNIRRQGEDVVKGKTVLPAGRRLRVEDIALLSALGIREVQVKRRLRVGLLSTGDEVTEPGDQLAPGQIWDSNRPLLKGLLASLGCDVVDLGIVADHDTKIESMLLDAASQCDFLVTSGGMSVGDGDYMRSVIERRGYLEVWPLAIKPGKPVGFGDIDDCPILALPGNSVAAALTFIAFGRPIVDHLAGVTLPLSDLLYLPAGFDADKNKGLRQFILAKALPSKEGSRLEPVPHQGPAMLSALTSTGGIAVLEEDRESVKPGDVLPFIPLAALFN